MIDATTADDDIGALLSSLNTSLSGIRSDSRQLQPGDAFAAYPGLHLDGRRYIPDAIARGAAAILWERRGFNWDRSWKVPHLPLEHLKARLGFFADYIYGHPSRDLWMVGVTGTNGKTSSAHWIASGLQDAGRRAAVLGTLGNGLLGAVEAAINTTPDGAYLHKLLAEYKSAGASAAVMEVSSHGLDQGRVNRSELTAVHGAGPGVVGLQPPAAVLPPGRSLDEKQVRPAGMPGDHQLPGPHAHGPPGPRSAPDQQPLTRPQRGLHRPLGDRDPPQRPAPRDSPAGHGPALPDSRPPQGVLSDADTP